MNIHEEQRGFQLGLELAAIVDRLCPDLRGARLSKIIERLNPARHARDFRSVVWFGKDYAFTPGQAAIVDVLWQEWERGTPKVGAGPLLQAADLVSNKVSKLFANHPAWGKMIMTDGDGVYWLQPPTARITQQSKEAA